MHVHRQGVVLAYDKECGSDYAGQIWFGQLGSPTTRDDRMYSVRTFSCGNQCCSGTCSRIKVTDYIVPGLRLIVLYEQVCSAKDTLREEASVGAEEFFFSSRRRHTRFDCDWSSDVCSSD